MSLTDFATIVAVAFLFSLIWQILRPHRSRVTESLAATLAAAVLAVAGGAYLTLRAGIGGQQAATAALLGVAAVLGIGRLVDAVLPVPALSGSRRRGLPGLVVGMAAAGALGAYYGSHGRPAHVGQGSAGGAGCRGRGRGRPTSASTPAWRRWAVTRPRVLPPSGPPGRCPPASAPPGRPGSSSWPCCPS